MTGKKLTNEGPQNIHIKHYDQNENDPQRGNKTSVKKHKIEQNKLFLLCWWHMYCMRNDILDLEISSTRLNDIHGIMDTTNTKLNYWSKW